ncbi:heme exporter protein CcmB [Salmonella enterica]|nr:heme exporter protein CcmB [Salmonella enterica]
MMWRVFCLELRVAFRHGADIAGPLWFFLMVITLFPLSVGPQPQLLARIAPGIIQVAALLASLLALERLFRDDLQDGSLEQLMLLPVPLPAVVLALERLFRDDLQDGSLEQLMLLPVPLPAVVLAKVLAHWAVTGLPLIMLSPLVALLLGMDVYGWKIMALTLLLGTPALGFLAAPGVALTAGLRRGGVLLGILVLPLSVPVLIFATAAMDAASMHLPVDGYLAVLGALLAGSATLSPFATAAALRISTQ